MEIRPLVSGVTPHADISLTSGNAQEPPRTRRARSLRLVRAAVLRKAPLIPPVFWTADPYGFRGIPLDVVRVLMSLPRSELMITFMVRDIRRFIGEMNHEAP